MPSVVRIDAATAGAGDVRVTQVGGRDVAIVALEGEHDLSTSAAVAVEIAKVAVRGVGVVVSLADAEFIDSSVLHTLFIGDRQMLAHGRRLVLYVGTDPRITTVLELANARERLYCCDSLEDAIDIASQRAPAYH